MHSETFEGNQQRRIVWLLMILGVVGMYIFAHLVFWQLFARSESMPVFTSNGTTLPATRGTIYDATGHPLALADVHYEVDVTPRLLSSGQIDRLVPELARIFDTSEEELYQVITNTNTTNFYVLGRELPSQVKQELDTLGEELMSDPDPTERFTLDAFVVQAEPIRSYPEGNLAASVLGIINKEGIKTGLELRYDEQIGGQDGQRSSLSGQLLSEEGGYQPVQDGADLVLSIDRNLQAEAERLLTQVVSDSKAVRGTIIILDAETGAVKTLANAPSFDPGDWNSWSKLEPWVFNNMAVNSTYEPRATFMPLTIAAALEANVITTGTTYDDHGALLVGGQRFVNWDVAKRPAIASSTLTDTLATSRIYGTVYIGSLMGPARFYEMIRRMGFGEPTGIDLPAEQSGEMPLPGASDWSLAYLGMNSIGRSLTATPMQLAAAWGVLANGGLLMRPYVVAEQRGDQVVTTEPYRVRRVISAENAAAVTSMLVEAVNSSAMGPIVPGYQFAGISSLTGTPGADNLPRGTLTSSYIGYGPLPDKRYVILVMIDQPQPVYFGTDVAQPVFRQMATYMVNYLGIAPSADAFEAN
ncbi:MAG: penicillin-binding protein 2 [Chloroflexi bacterium]|nr:penicillin-binding protein 2 [Chloroflexota bacterium]